MYTLNLTSKPAGVDEGLSWCSRFGVLGFSGLGFRASVFQGFRAFAFRGFAFRV